MSEDVRPRHTFYTIYGKRLLDVALAGMLLLAIAPLLLAVALAVRLRLGSPVLYRQARIGRSEAEFGLLKFRSMTDARDAQGRLLHDSERLVPFGLFLRRWSLDEWPQIFNVLKGDVSLVGPRPLIRRYLPRYTERQRQRHLVRPGMTGLAQVSGRSAISWEKRFELDIFYVENCSLFLDLKILFLTFRRLWEPDDIGAQGGGAAAEFWGSAGRPEEAPMAYPVDDKGH
ncbi:sugar transferase [Geminicoccaceae bacterium 1502E]|nr:sugar transferase [Geminicoccaceae bacterium 1502E]